MASEQTQQLLKRFEENPLIWGMFTFPHYFRIESPPFHLKIIKAAQENQYLAIQAPRGSAKSVILSFIKPTHAIVFKKKHFIIIVQNTFTKAAASLDNIKAEFRTNAKLAYYGIKFRKDAEGDSIFVHPDGFEVRVLCKGADQLGSIRGERFGAYRPDMILIDDLEDDKEVKNIELRESLERTFKDVLKYCGDIDTQIIVIGTILHDDSLMAKFVSKDKFTKFKKLFFRAKYFIDNKWISIWEQKWTVADLEEMEKDDPAGFAKEMMGDPSSGSQEAFNRNDFRYWRIENNMALLFDKEGNLTAKYNLRDCRAAMSCDLAWEEKRDSDSSVIFGAFLTPNNEVLFDTYIAKRGLRPDEAIETIYNMESRYEALTAKRVPVGFEKAKLEKVMKWLLLQATKQGRKTLWITDLVWDADKLTRIMLRLANRYSQHLIFHKNGMGELENQLVRLRSTAHDDIADAAQGVVQLFDRFGTIKPKLNKSDDEHTFKLLKKHAIKTQKQEKKPYHIGIKNRKKEFITAKTTIF